MKIARCAIALVAVLSFMLMAWSGASRYTRGRGLASESVLGVGILVGLAAAGAAAFVQHSRPAMGRVIDPEDRRWRG